MTSDQQEGIRLQKVLAKAGVGARDVEDSALGIDAALEAAVDGA